MYSSGKGTGGRYDGMSNDPHDPQDT